MKKENWQKLPWQEQVKRLDTLTGGSPVMYAIHGQMTKGGLKVEKEPGLVVYRCMFTFAGGLSSDMFVDDAGVSEPEAAKFGG